MSEHNPATEGRHQQRASDIGTPDGRYLISLEAVESRNPGHVVIHDTDHLSEECNTDAIKRRSRFNSLQWALDKGYRPCGHCMSTPDSPRA